MSNNNERYEQMLASIMDGLGDAILDMSDEAFLAECQENKEDIAAIAEEVRRTLLRALSDCGARSDDVVSVESPRQE
jgi:hypothetical protein